MSSTYYKINSSEGIKVRRWEEIWKDGRVRNSNYFKQLTPKKDSWDFK